MPLGRYRFSLFCNAELPESRTASKAKQDLPQCAGFFAQLSSRSKLHNEKIKITSKFLSKSSLSTFFQESLKQFLPLKEMNIKKIKNKKIIKKTTQQG
ncbi:MAG: hypothetical protein Q4E98_05905 [Acidaminococcaceae bacterium]|nr:hypothetical protein [Acidaminococcaceae bacterium]